MHQNIPADVRNENSNMFLLDAPGGTGKIYLITLFLSKIRMERNIAIAVASLDISTTILPGGWKAHSTFKLPLDLICMDEPLYNINFGSATAKLLRKAVLIIWNEATMTQRLDVEKLDKTLREIKEDSRFMSGVTLLVSGDFRQRLAVIPRKTKADEIKASIKSSYLW